MPCCTAGEVAVVLGGVLVPWEEGLGLGVLGGAKWHGWCVGARWCLEVRRATAWRCDRNTYGISIERRSCNNYCYYCENLWHAHCYSFKIESEA